jgi:Skp family chaperone for outer membrane proteins
MKQFHTVVIYLLLLLFFIDRFGSPSNSADQALAQAAPSPTRIGPAEAVDLVDKEGKKLSVQVADGRISWSNQPTSRALSFAVVEAGPIISDMMNRSQLAEEAQKLKDEADVEYAAMTAKTEALRRQLEGVDRASPEYRKVYEDYEQLRKEYDKWSNEMTKRHDALRVKQVSKVYEELIAAIEIVADRLDIDIVLQARETSDEISQTDYARAAWDVALRLVLKYPKSIDITEQVRQELGVKDQE